MATLRFLSTGWGRHLRKVVFIEDGERVVHLVPAAKAASEVRPVPVPPELVPGWLELLEQEYQRWLRRRRGDYEWAWDRSALVEWNDKVNRGFLKSRVPGSVDLNRFTIWQWMPLAQWWAPNCPPTPTGPYRELTSYDWSEAAENSGVIRHHRAPLLFNEVRRILDRLVESECASAVNEFRGSITRLKHLLPTLQESCCHHPCKARFRLAGSPLPGGS
jgi:hypothetical protein